MSNEEIIEVLEDLWKYEHSKFSEKEIREALEKGIEALKNQTSIIEKVKAELLTECPNTNARMICMGIIDKHIFKLKEGEEE